jgi:hypothetical protein
MSLHNILRVFYGALSAWLIFFSAPLLATEASALDKGLNARLNYASCPSLALDRESAPWKAQPLLLDLSVASNGELKNIAIINSSGNDNVNQSYFQWLSGCRFIAGLPKKGSVFSKVLVALKAQDPTSPFVAKEFSQTMLQCGPISYAQDPKRAGQKGSTEVNVLVSPGSAFVAAYVSVSSGFTDLDYLALRHVIQCQAPRVEVAPPMPEGFAFKRFYDWTYN